MWPRSLFGSRQNRSANKSARSASRDSRERNARRLFLEPLEDRRLLAFDPAVSYLTGANPQAVATGDFNDDLIADIAVANQGSSNISLLLGNTGGTFQAAVNSPTGAGPNSVAVGDFNRDGMLDLATANAADVSLLLGNGNGTFQGPVSIGLGSNPASVAVGDFNSDGKLDLVVTSNVQLPGSYYYGYYGGTYYQPGPLVGHSNVLMGNGAGSFAAPVTTFLGYGHHTAAAVADFNNDGNDDFATLNRDYGLATVLLGSAAGVLGIPATYATGWFPSALTVGEFTSDGILDLATGGQTIDILPGLGNGTFRPVVRQYIDPVSMAAADFNADGKLDLVSADPSVGVGVLLGLGTGALTLPLDFIAGTAPRAVVVGDFNGDSRPDVAAANASSGDVSVLLNDGVWPALNAPTLRIGDASVVEGNIGTTNITFNVTLSAASTQTVSVHYATADGSAAAGADFQAAAGIVTLAPGQLSQPVTVLVSGDRLAEYGESFYVRLTNPTSAFITDAVGAGTIMDDEPYVSINSTSGLEGNVGTTAMTFTVTLSAAYDLDVSVGYSTADGSAAAGSDYETTSGTLTIPAGQTSQTVTVLISGDRVAEQSVQYYYDYYGSYTYFEDSEYFSVNLNSSEQATIASGQGIGTIADDEPRISIGSATVVEGNAGTAALNFPVTLAAAYDAPVTVTYATADGSATLAGGDYQAATGSVTFAPGQTSQNIAVLVNGDRTLEYDEALNVNLTGATGAIINNAWGYGTIQDDEPRISINSASITEGRTGTKVMTFTVTLAAASDQAVTVNYATHDSSARVSNNDYVAKSGNLTFAPGQTSMTIAVTIKGDRRREADESFYVLLSGASSNALIANAYGWGTILNDDR